MMETLVDIEALALRCLSDAAKEYIREAVTCYQAGAFRACIVTTWIAVAYDLVDKIRELAIAGDAKAKQLEQKYETYLRQVDEGNAQAIKNALEFERQLIDVCKTELELFDPQQLVDLYRLREDRHRCAHPTFHRSGDPYRPSAEIARLHLRNAVVYVLSQPPVQGKAAIAELTKLVLSAYFPNDVQRAIEQFRNSPLRRPTTSLLGGLVDALTAGFCDPSSSLYQRNSAIVSLNALLQEHRATCEPRFKRQVSSLVRHLPDAGLPSVVHVVANVALGWELLERSERDRIIEFILRGAVTSVLPLLAALANLVGTRAAVDERIAELDYDSLAAGIEKHGFQALGKERAFSFLERATSWIRVNDVMTRTIFPLQGSLTKYDIERIVRMRTTHGADLPGASAFSKFVEDIRRTTMFEEDELNALLTANGSSYLVPQPDP